MTLQELKKQIELNTVTDDLIIFKDPEGFISDQYLNVIIKNKYGGDVEYIDSLDPFLNTKVSLFGDETLVSTSALRVLKCEVYEWAQDAIKQLPNLIIVAKKFSDKDIEKQFSNYIVSVPKLESWQITDYVYSLGEGADKKDLDLLIKLCGNNIFRLNQELDKLHLFSEIERKYVFQEMLRDGLLSDLSAFNIFNVITSIMSKDMQSLLSVYKELDRVDVNEFGLLTLLLKNFRNLIMVYFNSNPTPETTGLDSKVIYAIRKQPLKYNQEQIVKAFEFLCDIDRQVKSGELPADILIDYLLIKTLSV